MSSIGDLLNRFVADDADRRIAFIQDGRSVTYKEAAERIQGLVSFFRAKGVKPGDRVAISLPNGVDFACCYLSAFWAGFTLVPINQKLSDSDIAHILAVTRPVLKILDPADIAEARPEALAAKPVWPDDKTLYGIFFTSGTTSTPKGVCHSARALIENAKAFNTLQKQGEEMRMLHVMPMGYMAGFLNTLVCPLVAGGTVIIAPPFDAQSAMTFWDRPMAGGANCAWLSPTMVALVTRVTRSRDIIAWVGEHMRHVFVGTAPLLPSVKQDFETLFNVRCLESYGSTELLLISGNAPDVPEKQGCAGTLLDRTEIRINPEDEEISLRSPYAYKGYVHDDIGAIETFPQGAWFVTGDCGEVDHLNRLSITGRKKDLIIHGGINVSPKAVENTLIQYPGIREAAVIGKKHPFWGEEVVAFLVLDPGKTFDQPAIRQHCMDRLNPDAVPTAFHVVEELPRSSTGKIQKHLLRERA